ncbi:MAG: nuclear transport factor 2 family protein [Leucobacter sp.]
MTAETERNKRVVERFVEEVPQKRNLEVIDEVIAEDYIQHNPDAGQGREGVREFFANFFDEVLDTAMHPSGIISVNLIAEGEFVVRQEIRNNGTLTDIWRVKNGMLQEHWDAWRPAEGHERLPGF